MDREQLVRAAVAAFNDQAVGEFMSTVHPEIEWIEDPAYPGSSVYHGQEGVIESLEKWWETWEEMHTTVEQVEERGDRMLVLGRTRVRGEQTGLSFEAESGIVYDFEGDLVRRVRFFGSHAQAREAAGF